MIYLRKFSLFLATIAALPTMTAIAQKSSVDLGGSYTYVHTNLVPGCSCFSLNGGSAQVQVSLARHVAVVADLSAGARSHITPDGYQLTQLTYTFGGRYTPSPRARVSPFGEALFGGAHTFGTLAPGNNAIGGSSNAIALRTGGGLLLRVGSRLHVMPVEATYLFTNFRNSAANRQNDIQLSAGFLVRIGK